MHRAANIGDRVQVEQADGTVGATAVEELVALLFGGLAD
jgi:hypothetical protein